MLLCKNKYKSRYSPWIPASPSCLSYSVILHFLPCYSLHPFLSTLSVPPSLAFSLLLPLILFHQYSVMLSRFLPLFPVPPVHSSPCYASSLCIFNFSTSLLHPCIPPFTITMHDSIPFLTIHVQESTSLFAMSFLFAFRFPSLHCISTPRIAHKYIFHFHGSCPSFPSLFS